MERGGEETAEGGDGMRRGEGGEGAEGGEGGGRGGEAKG